MKFIRNILKGASLTTALFVFQACYGAPHPDYYRPSVVIKVNDAISGDPVENARVRIREDESQPWGKTTYSNEKGDAVIFFDEEIVGKNMELEVVANAETFQRLDTVIVDFGEKDITLGIKRIK